MGLFTKAHWLKPISVISHTSFLGPVSFCYCRTSGDLKRKKTPKFWFCSTVGPGLHVQPGPKANKRNRWHPSKGSHPGRISHYTNLHRLFCITNGCTVAFKVLFEYQWAAWSTLLSKGAGFLIWHKKSHSKWSCRNPLLWECPIPPGHSHPALEWQERGGPAQAHWLQQALSFAG